MKTTKNTIECWVIVDHREKMLWNSMCEGFYETRKDAKDYIKSFESSNPDIVGKLEACKITIRLVEHPYLTKK
jgi:hypothetical protein